MGGAQSLRIGQVRVELCRGRYGESCYIVCSNTRTGVTEIMSIRHQIREPFRVWLEQDFQGFHVFQRRITMFERTTYHGAYTIPAHVMGGDVPLAAVPEE